MRGEFVDVGGTRLYCHAAGSRGTGTPLVLLHGFPTSAHVWAGLLPLLRPGHRVLCVDLLGFGRSDPPAGHDVTVVGHAARVGALLGLLGISRAVLVGHDVGAAVAWHVAAREPSRVAGLVLLAPTDPAAPAGARKLGAVTRAWPAGPRRWWLRRAIERGWHHAPAAGRAREAAAYLRPVGATAVSAHLAALGAVAGPPRPLPPALPVAVVGGAHDPWARADTVRRLAGTVPGASCDILPDAGHFLVDDAPHDVARAVHSVLDR